MSRPFARLRRTLRYAAIRGGLELVAALRTLGIAPATAGRGIAFTLHHVRPADEIRPGPNEHLSVTPEFLAEAIEAALAAGLVPVALEDLPTLLADPADTRRFVCFTLDDGYRDNARHAAPVFRRFQVPYTVFVTTDFVDRRHTVWWETAELLTETVDAFEFDFGDGPVRVDCRGRQAKMNAFDRLCDFVAEGGEDDAVARIDATARACGVVPEAIVDDLFMTPDELRALAADPLCRLGAHTETHVNLRRVAADRLRDEVVRSADRIEEWVGRRPREFCYPYGWGIAVGPREVDAVQDAGYAVAVTTRPGVLERTRPRDTLTLSRVSLNGYYQRRRWVEALITGLPFVGH